MKNSALFIYIFLFFCLSCEESLRTPEISEGVNLRVQFTEGKSYFDFSDLSNAEIEYTVFTENNNIESVEIGLTLIPDGKTVFDRIVIETFTLEDFIDGSLTKSLRGQEMARLIGYTGINDFDGGELFNFDVVVTLDDGRIYPELTINTPDSKVENINISPNIQQTSTASFTQNFSTFVGCPTQIIAGTYIANATDPNVPCSNDPFANLDILKNDKEVELKQIGFISWEFSDVTRNYYEWVDLGNQENQESQMFDICNSLISYDNKGALFNIVSSGTHNPVTHQIDLQWIDLGNQLITCENTFLLK